MTMSGSGRDWIRICQQTKEKSRYMFAQVVFYSETSENISFTVKPVNSNPAK
jgi:hypothetical protein